MTTPTPKLTRGAAFTPHPDCRLSTYRPAWEAEGIGEWCDRANLCWYLVVDGRVHSVWGLGAYRAMGRVYRKMRERRGN